MEHRGNQLLEFKWSHTTKESAYNPARFMHSTVDNVLHCLKRYAHYNSTFFNAHLPSEHQHILRKPHLPRLHQGILGAVAYLELFS